MNGAFCVSGPITFISIRHPDSHQASARRLQRASRPEGPCGWTAIKQTSPQITLIGRGFIDLKFSFVWHSPRGLADSFLYKCMVDRSRPRLR